jgi:hypothetical protein
MGRATKLCFGVGTPASDIVKDWDCTSTLMALKEHPATQLPHMVQRSA